MIITYIGHSCFKLQHNGSSVIFDPYANGYVPGLKNIDEEADLVLCSHDHGDHNAKDVVKLTGKPCSFDVTSLETYHDHAQGTKRGMNRVHIVTIDDCKIVHMGDIGCPLTDEQISMLKDAHVLLIPVGGFFTIDANEAVKMVNQLTPKTVIPMHYRNGDIGFDRISTVDEFISNFDNVCYADSEYILNDEKLVVMLPKNK